MAGRKRPTPAHALTLDGHEVRFLDVLLARLQPKVIAGDLGAIEQSIKAMELRRRYTSAPTRPGPW
jgi:hypothetical protein